MAHCKGIAVSSRLKWVGVHHGDAGQARLLEALSAESRAAIERHILPHGWVPMRTFIDVNVAADQLFGAGDLSLCQEMGAWAARENVPRLFKLFYRLGSPSYLFERSPKLWSAHYDSGRLEIRSGDADAQASLLDFVEPHRAHCLSVLGWISATVELAGKRVTESSEVSCRTQGAASCELRVSWR